MIRIGREDGLALVGADGSSGGVPPGDGPGRLGNPGRHWPCCTARPCSRPTHPARAPPRRSGPFAGRGVFATAVSLADEGPERAAGYDLSRRNRHLRRSVVAEGVHGHLFGEARRDAASASLRLRRLAGPLGGSGPARSQPMMRGCRAVGTRAPAYGPVGDPRGAPLPSTPSCMAEVFPAPRIWARARRADHSGRGAAFRNGGSGMVRFGTSRAMASGHPSRRGTDASRWRSSTLPPRPLPGRRPSPPCLEKRTNRRPTLRLAGPLALRRPVAAGRAFGLAETRDGIDAGPQRGGWPETLQGPAMSGCRPPGGPDAAALAVRGYVPPGAGLIRRPDPEARRQQGPAGRGDARRHRRHAGEARHALPARRGGRAEHAARPGCHAACAGGGLAAAGIRARQAIHGPASGGTRPGEGSHSGTISGSFAPCRIILQSFCASALQVSRFG